MNVSRKSISLFTLLLSFLAEGGCSNIVGFVDGVVEKNVVTWHDIPYAQPPIGDLHYSRIFLTQP